MTLMREQVSGIVRRPRLEARLDRLADPATDASLMLVSAPPGFGKSTLVNAWARDQGRDRPVAIAGLQDAGSGPRALWRELVAAIARAVPPALGAELDRLAVPDILGHEDFLVELLDALSAQPLVLVLDDVHEIHNPTVLAELDRLVTRAPSSLALVLVSRTRPPLPRLHDLRLRGELDQLRAPDLAFTPEESAACCPELTDAQRQLVWQRTEGWPAMVRLMQLAVQDGLSESDFWNEDDGLAEHLFTEVFSRQEPDVQQVLLMCAVADPAPLDLVVRLSGRNDAGATLTATGRRSGLVAVVSRSDGTSAFHLHPILRAYLHGELLRRDARAEHRAQAEAAAWFRERGEALDAVRHALAAAEPRVLEDTLAAVGLQAVHEGLSEPLLDVLGTGLSRSTLGRWTTVVGAAALLDVGRASEAAAVLGPGEAAEDTDSGLVAAHAAVAALLRRRRGRPVPPGKQHPSDLPVDVPPDVELAFALHRGTELLRAGALDAAEALLVRAAELAEGLGRDAALTDASVSLAGVSSARANVATLNLRIERARAVAEQAGWIGSARAAYLHMLAGWAAHQQLDDGEARRLAQRASDLVDPRDDPSVVMAVHSLLTGCAEGAEAADTGWLHEAWQDSDDQRLAPDIVAYTAVTDAAVSLAAGRVDRLRVLVDGVLERLGQSAETLLVASHLRLARGQNAQAQATLEPALRGEVPPVFPLSMVNAHTFACRLAIESDNHYRAVAEMRLALEVADRLGCPRALLAGGRPGLELLVEGRGAWGPHEELVRAVLGYATLPPGRPAVALTDRELDVLRELPTLRTVEEIAGDMVVSVNTLKTHLRSVYRKLGVTSRRDAVTEARRAGLL